MNELKVRVWDTEKKKMHNSIQELYFENGRLIEIIYKTWWEGTGSCTEERCEWQEANECKIMLYIGKKDRNGKEIFEGDIVQWRALSDGAVRNDYIKGIVEYKGDTFQVTQISEGKCKIDHNDYESDVHFYDYDGPNFSWENLEVIGNIYENLDDNK